MGEGMGLEQYAGMSDEQKLVALLVKMDNIEYRFDGLEKRIDTKPCPSPECLRCQQDLADLKSWRVKREAELNRDAESEQDDQEREAWVVPMWAMVIMTAVSLIVTVGLALSTGG